MSKAHTVIDPTELPVIDSQAEPLKIFEELKANNCRRCEQRHKFWEKRGNRQMRKTTHGERRKFRKLGRGNEDRDREARELLHLDQAYIITPASTECRACGALWSLAEGILEAYGIAYSNDISLEWLATRSQLLVKGPSKSQARLFQAFIPRGCGFPVQGFHQSSALLGDTASKASLDRAKAWIERCEKDHSCGNLRNDRKFPGRLIDLTPIYRNSKSASAGRRPWSWWHWRSVKERMQSLLVGPAVPCQGVKIVSSFPQDAKWACLSHCWGTTLNPIKLNKKSYKQYHDFISVAKLPKSFQDALRIARYLGLKYLWIDCFCIEQGSAIDFDMEASKMADVYRNSFILIVAAAAADSHGGCLIKSDPDKFIRITVDSQQNLYFGVRQCKFTKELEELTDVYEEFPTHERAWCYQEQVLAQRLLFCTNHELTFECRDLRACECDNHHMAPHISPSHGGHPARRRLLIRDKALIATLNSVRAKCYSVATINQCWEAAVYHYSRLKLGHAEQRLSALSGLAKTFQMISGRLRSENIYLAGLWRKAIRANLLWRVSKPSQIGTGRPRIYRAPSWSWASVDTPSGVDFLAGSSHQSSWLDMSDWEGFLVDANSVPSATDTTGAVKSGFLRFKTHLRIAHVRMPCSYCKNAMGLHGKGKRVQLETDCRQHRCTFHGERLQSLRGSFEFFNDCTLREEPGLRWKKSSGFRRQARPCMLAEIYLLHVAKSVTQKNCVDHFLALKKTKESCWRRACRYLLQGKEENARYPQFKRIGLVTMVHRKEDVRERWFETVWKAGFTSQEKVLIDLV